MRIMWTVFSKEFLDIVRDRRRFILTLLSTFVFFPLMFILPYSYLITRTVKQTVDVVMIPVQGMQNAPELITYLVEEEEFQVVEAQNVEALVKDKQYAVGLIIPDDYEKKINNEHPVELVLVADKRRSMDVTFTRLETAINEYGTQILQARLVEIGMEEDFFTPITVKQQNVASVTETAGSRAGLFIPGMIISFGLTAGMPIAISSIAGEKKKLTLEPVLFTTVSRFQLVFAKLLAVLVGVLMNLLSIGLSFLIMAAGILLIVARNLPLDKIASSSAGNASASLSPLAGYHIDPLAIVLFLLAPFLIILFGSALQILVSAWARNDEEATTYLMPLSLFSGLIVMVMFVLDDISIRLWHYAIPVLGTIISMRDLLSNKIDPASLTVMFGTSTLYALLMLVLAVWMFQREEVVFRT